ncbi:GNAT family N-acetyltransferase [Parerythrobacter jejuensis]|uniref:GNAT family N-acetyltransferase n=1 Tax=Parerythrobacter jejuensis TaxID=795812 RepID=A0A845AQA5_9SPHN|nr:GNAT family N-acetyltransferase [Parerythrobacter jejuensis]MXP31363.1 GNAT family N-acetyltransferase [Parerythrobacter jejuensis]MXP34123.1 GNAT family N-acetyltransferase [Parerythrobacter jejuensis]
MSPAELDRQPTLEGPTLILRPLQREDWSGLFAVASDRLLWEQHPAHDRWQEPVFRTFFDDALEQSGALAVIDKATGAIIGSSRYQGLELGNGGSVEIGWTFLARSFWGGDANREMKRLMIAHALASVAECRFAVGEDNWRSRKAMEKIGGVLGSRVEVRQMADGPSRHVHYTIGQAEFDAGPLGCSG